MGGGVMRTAAKVAGVGVVNAGLRGAPAVQPVEQPMAAAARKATVPVSSVVSSAKLGDAPVAVQRPSWELDDWEFASVVEEINVGTGEPLPRVVFGGVPTLQEAKEATSELKDALDQLYLSPSRSIGSGVQQLGLLQIANSDHLETKACVATAENTVATVPAHAIQAFAFLKDSPAAQNVVASIASDPNVWSAVMQNEALVDFLQAQKTCAPYPSMGLNVEESVADTGFQDQEAPKSFEDSSDEGDSGSRFETPKSFEDSSDAGDSRSLSSWFATLLETMKLSLAEMVGNIFGRPADDDKSSPDSNEKAEGQSMNFMNMGLGASLTGLAVMVIMVVVMKRV
ncbi:hypothetical protein PVL29_025539 [Vitis rotundifolia]|uniref:Uncharacterized protein n=1 Tax=Vitis rotundifolia TaxID=103349 RepID=A0AA39D5J7_VITRO|nr:hypothetical protein PVL29_025539 [Vitis rotundifolia]